jgi:hypothetical protein
MELDPATMTVVVAEAAAVIERLLAHEAVLSERARMDVALIADTALDGLIDMTALVAEGALLARPITAVTAA